MEWIAAILASVAAFFAARQYDRIKIQGAMEELGELRTRNESLVAEIEELREDLRNAKRAVMDHDDVSDRLRDLADPDSSGRV